MYFLEQKYPSNNWGLGKLNSYGFAGGSVLCLLAHHEIDDILNFLADVLVKFDVCIADSVVEFFVSGSC